MAGLLDQYQLAGNEQALDLVLRMAGWVHTVVERSIAKGGQQLWQHVLGTEWGGMNDVLFHLFALTGNQTHYDTARRFNAWVFTDRLADGVDDLGILPFPHANFHLPEMVGSARAFELTGNSTDEKVSRYFFDALVQNHSYATGGSNSGECWQKPRDLGAFLDQQTEESCTQYNVLKLARRLFLREGAAAYMDFYEGGILNGIIGNQNRMEADMTSYIYMLPLGGVSSKPWGKSDYGFPCCWGTLSETFAKLSDTLYFESTDNSTLYVAQFVNSTLDWDGKVKLTQTASFPVSLTGTSTFHISISEDQDPFEIKIRVPAWATSGGTITLDAASPTPAGPPGSWATVESTQFTSSSGLIEVHYPMGLWSNPLNDFHPEYNATMAFMYGPLVLAGVGVTTDIFVPHGNAFRANPSSFIHRNSSTALEFEALAADGTKIRMIPLKDVMDEKYVVYFMTAGTRPAQPPNPYCPHSHSESENTQEHEFPPAPAPALKSKGAHWRVANGIMFSGSSQSSHNAEL